MTELSEDDLRAFAADVILDHAQDVDFLDEDGELSDADFRRVDKFIGEAIIRVSWRGHDIVYGNDFEDDEDDE